MDSWTKDNMNGERNQTQAKLNLLTLSEQPYQAWCNLPHGCTTKLAKNIHFISDLLRKTLKWHKPWALFNGVAPAELVDQWCLLHQQVTVLSTMTEIGNIFYFNKSKKTEEAWPICPSKFKVRKRSLPILETQLQDTKWKWISILLLHKNSRNNRQWHMKSQESMLMLHTRRIITLREIWLNIRQLFMLWIQNIL